MGLKNPCHSIGKKSIKGLNQSIGMLILPDLNQSISRTECGDVTGVAHAIVCLAVIPKRVAVAEKSVLGGFVNCVRLAIHQVLHVAEHANTNWIIEH